MESGLKMTEQDGHEELIERLNGRDDWKPSEVLSLLEEVRIEDIAEVFPHLKDPVKDAIIDSLDEERAAELLSELDEVAAIQILKDMSPERIAAVLNCLPPDEGADLIGYSSAEEQPDILDRMDRDLAGQVQTLATYSPDTAGGVMTSEFMAAHPGETVRSVLIRIKTSERAESIQNVYVVDDGGRLLGVVSVRELLQARLNQKVEEIMEADVVTVPLDMDREEVSRIVNRYDLSSIPVVDAAGGIKGIVTFDDVMDVIEEESSEDLYRMAGEVSLHPTQQPVWRRVAARLPWVLITLGGTYCDSLIIRFYESYFNASSSQVETLWTLVVCFVPMIGGMAGNVGNQSSAVMVRGLATGEVYPSILFKILIKEIFIAAIIGLISGLAIGSLLVLLRGTIGYVVGLALFSAIVSASFLGTMMPFACLACRVDPAYASGPILSTMNDLLGFTIYFSIALPLML